MGIVTLVVIGKMPMTKRRKKATGKNVIGAGKPINVRENAKKARDRDIRPRSLRIALAEKKKRGFLPSSE